MKIHRDLSFEGSIQDFEQFIQNIDAILSSGWTRNVHRETDLSRLSGTLWSFNCDKRDNRNAADLFIYPNNDRYEVTNIVPCEIGSLTIKEYNVIIEDFYNRYVHNVADDHNIRATLTSEEFSLSTWLSNDTITLLERFSGCANKSTGSGHPIDEERWHAFIIASHLENSTLSAHYLGRWLNEEEGWEEGIAFDLSSEYEKAQMLLNHYDQHRTD